MSGTAAEIKARHEEFATRLIALVNEFGDVVGPSVDPLDNDICDHEADETCDCALPTDVMVTEWSLLTNWVRLTAEDQSWSTALHAPGMLRSHKIGLLVSHTPR